MSDILTKFPKMSDTQCRVLDALVNGAEIQVTYFNSRYEYSLCHENGDSEEIKSATFNRLKEVGLIKHKWTPSLNVERWS